MSLESKSSKSRRRADFGNQVTPSVGFRKLLALHQMSAGQTDINLTALSVPSNLNFPFQNPSVADLLSANIAFFKNNVTVKRTDGGELIQGIEFGVISNSVIRLASPAQGNTAVQITIDLAPVSPVNVAGGSPITASSVLAVGQTQVNTGVPFQTGLFASTGNIGAVMVFRNRQLLKRNTANSSSNLDQDYYELNTGLGVGTLIVLNRPGELLQNGDQEQIDIVSVGILLQAPTASMMAFFDSFGAQLDKIEQVLADVSGLPISAFAANPNQVDLRIFGDIVTAQGALINSLLHPGVNDSRVRGSPSLASTNTQILYFPTVVHNLGSAILYTPSATLGDSWTIQEDGIYMLKHDDNNLTGNIEFGITVDSTQLSTGISSQSDPNVVVAITSTISANILVCAQTTIPLLKGQVVRAHAGSGWSTGAAPDWEFRVVKVGRL